MNFVGCTALALVVYLPPPFHFGWSGLASLFCTAWYDVHSCRHGCSVAFRICVGDAEDVYEESGPCEYVNIHVNQLLWPPLSDVNAVRCQPFLCERVEVGAASIRRPYRFRKVGRRSCSNAHGSSLICLAKIKHSTLYAQTMGNGFSICIFASPGLVLIFDRSGPRRSIG